MNDLRTDVDASPDDPTNLELSNAWDQFWFTPTRATTVVSVRGLLCLITVAYFVSSFADAAFWYTDQGPLSSDRVSSFMQAGDLEGAAKWIVSPLFFAESAWVYRLYLAIGIAVAVLVAAGRGGRIACWSLWLLLVGWANRSMIVSGLTETLLSLGLFAAAIAPPQSSWRWLQKRDGDDDRLDWTSGFSERLIAVQVTLIGLATFVTMLAGRVWFNGLGAYALAAPVEDRTIDWTVPGSLFALPLVHESLTHLLVIALPLGFALAWLRKTNRIGQAILVLWCVVIALLGSHWLYASAMATMVLAIRPR